MPSTGVSIERVAIRPSTQGTRMAAWVVWAPWSGRPTRVKHAGAGSVCHIASIAAIFIFWFWPAM